MITEYSLARDGEKQVANNFKAKEFACKDGSEFFLVSDLLIEVLQKIRDHFDRPVTINSGYRSNSWNYKVGGSPTSKHLEGMAADIVVQGVSPLEVAEYAEYILGNKGGIGLYNGFVHIDTRPNRSRWDSRSGKEKVVEGFPGYKPVEPKPEAPLVTAYNAAGEALITLEGVYKGGNIYAPVRALCEALGHEVKYENGVVHIK